MDLITLSVQVNDDTRKSTYEEVSLWAASLVDSSEYVNVSSSLTDEDEDDEEASAETCDREHLYCDEETLDKVRSAIHRGMFEPLQPALGDAEDVNMLGVENVIRCLQNAGILFRERDRD